MSAEAKVWIRSMVTTLGTVAAGPVGALAGSLVGGLITSILPGVGMIGTEAVKTLTTRSILAVSGKLAASMEPREKQRINHNLQTAFRDAFHEALYDIGGEICFPSLKTKAVRDVPAEVLFATSTAGQPLWHSRNPLSAQVVDCMRAIENALNEERILALEPAPDRPAASVKPYLEAETPQALGAAFFEQNVAPVLVKFGSLTRELPEFEAHLRRYLFPRTLVHLTEMLKLRTPAWRAFNRMVLETLQSEIAQLGRGQNEIIQRLDALVSRPESSTMAEWSDAIADLLGEFGRLEFRTEEGFEDLTDRLIAQHQETVERLESLSKIAVRIESKVDRVLHILEDGHYVIEGDATVPLHRPPAPGDAPFMGLRPFAETDAERFFGREHLVARLAGRMQQTHFLAVIGASGSGKSSLIRAGLIPLLKGNRVLEQVPRLPGQSPAWGYLTITPGDHPLQALSNGLAQSFSDLDSGQLKEQMRTDQIALDRAIRESSTRKHHPSFLLVVDQFEELFTLCNNSQEQTAFVNNLLYASHQEAKGILRVIIILRADFYAECARFDPLRAAVSEHQEYVGPMSEAELRQAIEKPAEQAGWKFEPGLVDVILRETGSEPGALPLLSHALLETWQRRSSHTMTLESYVESGGVRSAIARTAEFIFTQTFRAEQQMLARNIFLRLINIDESGKVTRRRATLSEMSPGEDRNSVQQVINALAENRLVTLEEDIIQISHEALISGWPRLQGWIDDNRQSLMIHRRLTDSAHEWSRNFRDEGYLFRGIRLDETLEWLKTEPSDLNTLELEFIQSSKKVIEREQAEKEAARKRELESAQRLADAERQKAEVQSRAAAQLRRRAYLLSAALAGASLLLGLSIVLGILAQNANQKARQNAVLSANNAATAQAASTQAVAQQLKADIERQRAEVERARAETQRILAESGQLAALSQTALIENYPQRSLLLAVEANRLVKDYNGPQNLHARNMLWDALMNTGGQVVARHPTAIAYVTASPDGRWLATAGADNIIRLWRLDSHQLSIEPIELVGHSDVISEVLFTPDSKKIITTAYDGIPHIWDLTDMDPSASPLKLTKVSEKIQSACLSPDGRWLAAGGFDSLVWVWDLSAPDINASIITLPGHTAMIYGMAVSPDNRWLASVSGDKTARLWDLQSDDPTQNVLTLSGHQSFVFTVAFSPDGHWLATGSQDQTIRLWDVRSQNLIEAAHVLEGHEKYISTLAFSPDARWLISGSADGAVRRWDMQVPDPENSSTNLRGHSDWILKIAFSPNSRFLVTASGDRTARLWDIGLADPNQTVVVLRGHDAAISGAVFSTDSYLLFTASSDATVRSWAVEKSGLPPVPSVLTDASGTIGTVTFSPNGRWLVSGGADARVRLYDMQSQLVKHTLSQHEKGIYLQSVSPDSRWLVTTGFDGQAFLYDLLPTDIAGSAVRLAKFDDIATNIAFTPDSQRVAVGSRAGDVQLFSIKEKNPVRLVSWKGHGGGVSAVAIHPDGKWLAVGAWEGRLRIYDLREPERPPQMVDDCSGPAAFSPDGQWLASGCYAPNGDDVVRVWKVPAFTEQPQQLGPMQGFFIDLAFSPDSQWLAGGGKEFTTYLWKVQGDRFNAQPYMLRGHTDWIYGLAFHPARSLLATSSADQTLRVWDLKAADPSAEALTLHGHTDTVFGIAFSPDGRWLASGSQDKTVRLWSMDVDELIDPGNGSSISTSRNTERFALKVSGYFVDGSILACSVWGVMSCNIHKPIRPETATIPPKMM